MTYAEPLLPCLIFLLLGELLLGSKVKSYRRMLRRGCALGLILLTWGPAAWMAAGTLEWWYPDRPIPPADAEAIVVLSSAALPATFTRPYAVAGHGTYLRCLHGAWLYHNWRSLPILVSGGRLRGVSKEVVLADVMRDTLVGRGVPESMIWIEDRSRSTFENARYAAEFLRTRGIRRVAVVTEAYHMLRAEKCFRKQGLEVVPAPCGFRTDRESFSLQDLLPAATAIEHNNDTLHEWLGLGWYYLRGRV